MKYFSDIIQHFSYVWNTKIYMEVGKKDYGFSSCDAFR